jgi:lysophospholipase L1-like esterase
MNGDGGLKRMRRLAGPAVCWFLVCSTVVGLASGYRTRAASRSRAAPASCVGRHWVAAWGAASAYAASPGLASQTIRVMAQLHATGTRVRLRLSNRFGKGPLRLDAVDIGERAGIAGLRRGTDRIVRFAGRRTVTIAPGMEVISDPVSLPVRALEELAVSIYSRAPTGPVSSNLAIISDAVTYTASGDHVRDSASTDFSPGSTITKVLDRIDVLAARRVAAVVAFGDSITQGQGSSVDRPAGARNTRWPDFLARRLIRAHLPLSPVNEGIGGNRLRLGAPAQFPFYGPSGFHRMKFDVLDTPAATDVILALGINDIGLGPPYATARELIDALRRARAELQTAGLHVLVATLTPALGQTFNKAGTAEGNAERREVNQWIRSHTPPTDLVDFDKAVRDPAHPSYLADGYDSGDHIHPNARGYAKMASVIPLSGLLGNVCTLPHSSPGPPPDRGG